MKKIMGLLFVACVALFGLDKIATPTDYATVTNGTRANLKANFSEIESKFNSNVDTVVQTRGRFENWTTGLLMKSKSDLRLRLDDDATETARLLIEGSSAESLFTVREDSTWKAFGAGVGTKITLSDSIKAATANFSGLTASLPVFTNAGKTLASNAMTGTGSVVMSASPTFTGTVNLAAIAASGNATVGGTLGVTGASTLAGLSATTGSFSSTLGVTGVLTASAETRMAANGRIYGGDDSRLYFTPGTIPTTQMSLSARTGGHIDFKNDAGTTLHTFNQSGAISFGGVITASGGIVVGNDDAVLRSNNTNQTAIAGGNASNAGGNLVLYGGAHATLANNWLLRHGTTNDITYNGTTVAITPNTTIAGTLGVTGVSTLTGNVGIGTAPGAVAGLEVGPTTLTGINQYGASISPIFGSSATNSGISLNSQLRTTGSYTMAEGRGVYIATPSLSTTTVTNVTGLDIATQTGGGTNYAIRTGASGLIQLGSLTASSAVATDASKNLVSVTNTGTGNNVLSASPTLTGTIGAANATFSGTVDVTGKAGSADSLYAEDGLRVGATAASNVNWNRSGANMWNTPDSVTVAGRLAVTDSVSIGGNEKFGYDEGSFTGTLTGCTTSPTSTVYYVRVGKQVTLKASSGTCTSNTYEFTITGLPASLSPSTTAYMPMILTNNSATNFGTVRIDAGNTYLDFSVGASAAAMSFTNSGTKGLPYNMTMVYTLQ